VKWTILRNGLYAELFGAFLNKASSDLHGLIGRPQRDPLAIATATAAARRPRRD
jgi:hypothetical protein